MAKLVECDSHRTESLKKPIHHARQCDFALGQFASCASARRGRLRWGRGLWQSCLCCSLGESEVLLLGHNHIFFRNRKKKYGDVTIILQILWWSQTIKFRTESRSKRALKTFNPRLSISNNYHILATPGMIVTMCKRYDKFRAEIYGNCSFVLTRW